MDRSLDRLRRRRAEVWRKEIGPYLRYMGQSGFPGFLALLGIIGFIGYISFLRDVPPDFPIAAAGAAALLAPVAWSPLRSRLAPADIVFLLRREADMRAYIFPPLRAGVALGAAWTLAVFALYWPLYRQGAVPTGWLPLALSLLALKAANGCGAWQERRMAWQAPRRLLRLLRWLACGLLLLALLSRPLWQAASFGLLLAAALAAAYRLPRRHRFPWERLIAEEERARRRWYRFYGLFIDVPASGQAVARRPYIAWLAGRVRFARRGAFVYLYALTLCRTELGGMLLRLAALGAVVAYLTARGGLLAGWGAAGAALLFAAVTGVQAGSLRHAHKHSVWRHVYPLPDASHRGAVVAVARIAHLGAALPVALAAALPLFAGGMRAAAAAALLVPLLYAVFAAPRSLRRRLGKEADD